MLLTFAIIWSISIRSLYILGVIFFPFFSIAFFKFAVISDNPSEELADPWPISFLPKMAPFFMKSW